MLTWFGLLNILISYLFGIYYLYFVILPASGSKSRITKTKKQINIKFKNQNAY
jgi:hypothetical protein